MFGFQIFCAFKITINSYVTVTTNCICSMYLDTCLYIVYPYCLLQHKIKVINNIDSVKKLPLIIKR